MFNVVHKSMLDVNCFRLKLMQETVLVLLKLKRKASTLLLLRFSNLEPITKVQEV